VAASPVRRTAWPTWLVTGVVLANLALAGLAAGALAASYDRYRHDADVTSQNLAKLFERSIATSFDRVDVSLRLLASVELPPSNDEASRHRLREMLDAHLAAQPDVRSMQVFDANGDALAATNLPAGKTTNVRGHEVFVALQNSPVPPLVVSKPRRNLVGDQWVIVLGRRLASANGSFVGVTAATVPLDYFQRLLSSVDIGGEGAIAVRDLDYGLVARWPDHEPLGLAVGDQRMSAQAREALGANPAHGTYATKASSSDQVERSVSYRRVEGYPFYVIVGLGSNDFLAGWYGELRKAAMLVSLFALVTITLATMLARLLRRRETDLATMLHEAEQGRDRFARLFRGTPTATMIMAMSDRRVLDVNEAFCRRYGVTREQVVGRPPGETGIGPTEEYRRPFWQQLVQHGHVNNFVARVRLANGEIRESLINGELIDYQGESCALATSLDITELRQAERAREAQLVAETANRAKTEFLSRMSHELRTPLNAVIGFSELLRDEASQRLSTAELTQLEHIRQAGWYLLTLTNDVLDISRIEAGQFQVDLRPLAVRPVLHEALHLSRSLARKHEVTLVIPAEPSESLALRADPIRLQQVLLNLVSNAVKYNRPGGTVWLQAGGPADGLVCIEVIDDGLGMTPEQLQQLYQPFNRLGRERSAVEGAGIGLALTRQLVRLLHGRLEVDSEAGLGTHVRLWLPASDSPPTDPPAPSATLVITDRADAAPSTPPAGTVLYVEDNPVNAMLVKQLLARWVDVRFVLAEDGHSGVAQARALLPDLVLLDMQLPDINGEEVLQQLRSQPATRHLRIIALSANAMAEDVERARQFGANDYWTKPINPARFLAEVRALLGRVSVP